MQFSVNELISITHSKQLTVVPAQEIKYVVIDSRIFSKPEQSIFIAIKGPNNDGHKYLKEVYAHGIKNFIIDNIEFFNQLGNDIKQNANFLLCSNSITALQLIAREHRLKFNIPVVGITGSNGKTIVKEWISQLGAKQQKIRLSPKSYNSQVGVALSVLGLRSGDELAVFEAGISLPDEMGRLENIILPDIGLITNIGPAHQEGFESLKQKLIEKLLLFKNAKKILFCEDMPLIAETVRKLKAEKFFSNNPEFFTWSAKLNADLIIEKTGNDDSNQNFMLKWKDEQFFVSLPFNDEISHENLMHTLLVLFVLGFDKEMIISSIPQLSPIEMRLEIKEGVNNCTIINDAYNSDLYSLAIALDFLKNRDKTKSKTLILSDILQSGTSDTELYQRIAQLAELHEIRKFIGIGEKLSLFQKFFSTDSRFYKNVNDFAAQLNPSEFRDEVILIKGARSFQLEKITDSLQKKTHSTVLEINLNHLIHNLNVYRSHCKPDTKMMVMVKAFGYGSGNVEISKALQYHQVDYLGVAFADEGIELRNAGINMPVMVMNPDVASLDLIIRGNLEPEIYSFKLLNALIDSYNRSALSGFIKIHLKFDTGMHRLGFQYRDIDKITEILKSHPFLHLASVFSHLAASEIAEYDDFSLSQIQLFNSVCNKLSENLKTNFIRHLLNSSGIVRFKDAQFEMVRLGIGLYGIDGSDLLQNHLKNVITFKSSVSQIREVKKGESIGYSRAFVADKDMKVATIGVGYADGFSRKLGNNKGKVMINGKPAPITGNICMDMCMADITDIDVSEGDEVIIFNSKEDIEQMANLADTIPYEVLTSISQRVKRVYYNE